MIRIKGRIWVPRILFWSCIGVAVVLMILVMLAPLLASGGRELHGWRRLLALFGHDAALRRTSLASAIGLSVTGCIFFRVPARPRSRGPKLPPPVDIVGA
jgi:hypothetical protein